MNILNKCYEGQDDRAPKACTLAPHFLNLRGSTVQAMSNMLSANIDSGLMHSVGNVSIFLQFLYYFIGSIPLNREFS